MVLPVMFFLLCFVALTSYELCLQNLSLESEVQAKRAEESELLDRLREKTKAGIFPFVSMYRNVGFALQYNFFISLSQGSKMGAICFVPVCTNQRIRNYIEG